MAPTLPDDPRDLGLGIVAGAFGVLLGLGFGGVAVTNEVATFDHPMMAGVLIAVVFAFTAAGLYEITAATAPERGVAHLTIGAGIVLALLGPYADSPRTFVAVGAVAVVVASGHQVAHATRLIPRSDDAAAEVEREGAT